MANPDDVFETAEQILQTVNTVYAEHEVELPTRQYIAVGNAGSTPHDCTQVTVTLGALGSGLPQGQPMPGCTNVTNGVFIVEIVREIATVSGGRSTGKVAPTPEAISTKSKVQMKDARLLAEVAERMGQTTINRNAVYSVTAGAPSGDAQGILLELNIAV